ncbi:MAG: glycoside hydrolase family 32 protein [Bacteroidota bacterium]
MLRFTSLLLLLFSSSVFSQKINYKEKHRPQFHFSPPAKWMNDPNGMVYYKGEYHLFYQYYPDSTMWGPMHWGHAISKDLVHWQHLPIALYPDSLGLIFSGSVVVDKNNTSGLQRGVEKPLVALFTYHDLKKEKAGVATDFQYQGMAYSLDKGRTWKKYENNPVIKNQGTKDFRDPKVFWHQASKHWVMVLAVADRIEFYHSQNLKEWSYTGTFGKEDGSHGGVWECPDLVEMKIDGTKNTKWVLIVSIGNGGPNGGSATQYFVGDFNGQTFVNANSKETIYWLDFGPDDYAGVTWSNTGDQKLFLGWMSNWNYAQLVPTKSWRSAMTIPRELSLKNTVAGHRLFSTPVKNLVALQQKPQVISIAKPNITKGLTEVIVSFDLSKSTATDVGVSFSNYENEILKVGYNKELNQFYIDRSSAGDTSFSTSFTGKAIAPRILNSNLIKLHIFIDHSSVELFADDGSVVLTSLFFPTQILDSIQLYNNKGKLPLQQAIMYPLKSVWE